MQRTLVFIALKMSGFVPKKEHLREALLFCFHLKKSAAEIHRLLFKANGEHTLSETTHRHWFRRFKDNDYDVKDKERPGQPKKFEDGELEALLEEDSCQTLKELSETLHVDESTVSKRLKAMGMIQKLGNWIPHELRERDITLNHM